MGQTEKTDDCGEWTLADFDTSAPYDYLYSIKNEFDQQVESDAMEKYAASLGFKKFKSRWNAYKRSKKQALSNVITVADNMADVPDQKLELATGQWTMDESGIYDHNGEKICAHPLMPVAIVRNVDTEEQSIRLEYRINGSKGVQCGSIVAPSSTIFNAKNITELAKFGISVVSGARAQSLVNCLRDLVDLNRNIIPIEEASSHLGWTGGENQPKVFVPYSGNIQFCGMESFRDTFNAIHSHGNRDKWLAEASKCRKHSTEVRLVMDASVASVLLDLLNCLPFFVHLWSPESGIGKSVALSLAASMWGQPKVGGQYVKTFKSTTVAMELLAGVLNSLPMFVDELQMAKDSRGRLNFNVYELASGAGKNRGNKGLGINRGITWANCIITSGESPLTDIADGAGAINRVLDICCPPGKKIIQNGNKTTGIVNENYGFEGERIIEWISDDDHMDLIKQKFEEFNNQLIEANTSDKQAMAAALLLLGDYVSCQVTFPDDEPLGVSDIVSYLKTNEEIDYGERGYQLICGWISKTGSHFVDERSQQTTYEGVSTRPTDIYGKLVKSDDKTEWAIIGKSVWEQACADMGISSSALIEGLKQKELIEYNDKTPYINRRINGMRLASIKMKLPSDDDQDLQTGIFTELDNDEALPF